MPMGQSRHALRDTELLPPQRDMHGAQADTGVQHNTHMKQNWTYLPVGNYH